MSMSAADVPSPDRPAPAEAEFAAPQGEGPELIIKPRRGWIPVDWRELVSHRELLLFLIWRDVKVKYKQAILGVAWAVFVPLISVTLFTVIGKAAGFDSKVNGSVTTRDDIVHRGAVTHMPDGWMIRLSDGTDRLVPLTQATAHTDNSVTRKDGTVYQG